MSLSFNAHLKRSSPSEPFTLIIRSTDVDVYQSNGTKLEPYTEYSYSSLMNFYVYDSSDKIYYPVCFVFGETSTYSWCFPYTSLGNLIVNNASIYDYVVTIYTEPVGNTSLRFYNTSNVNLVLTQPNSSTRTVVEAGSYSEPTITINDTIQVEQETNGFLLLLQGNNIDKINYGDKDTSLRTQIGVLNPKYNDYNTITYYGPDNKTITIDYTNTTTPVITNT